MRPDCKVNMSKLTDIVDSMLAEKNELGRKAFKKMSENLIQKNKVTEWSNPNFDSEGAFETLYDELNDLIGQYSDIVNGGSTSPHQDPADIEHRKVYKEVAEELKNLVSKVAQEYGV